MDCGIPFCHNGCPLGNLIPEWNDLARRADWAEAGERLHATNNFPEFTGRLCPAPCETACVLGIADDPVTIKQIEWTIADRAWDEGWVRPVPPAEKTGMRVAVVGSGPAGLAAAQQLTRAGHDVVVYERDDRIGGLLRYGIPEFKMEKARPGPPAGADAAGGHSVRARLHRRRRCDRRAAACRPTMRSCSRAARRCPVTCRCPGRELAGIQFAMDYLTPSNRVQEGDLDESPISAAGKHVVIIGGGDTGADCLGTAHRQGARSVTQLEILPRPPDQRADSTPWPLWPLMYRASAAHEEGGERVFAVSTERFDDDGEGRVRALVLNEVVFVDGRFEQVPGTRRELPCELVLLAMGFTGAERGPLLQGLGVELDARGNVARDASWRTNQPGVYVCGDMGRGQSLIVWAIAEGRACAAAVDRDLTGDTLLPEPLAPTRR